MSDFLFPPNWPFLKEPKDLAYYFIEEISNHPERIAYFTKAPTEVRDTLETFARTKKLPLPPKHVHDQTTVHEWTKKSLPDAVAIFKDLLLVGAREELADDILFTPVQRRNLPEHLQHFKHAPTQVRHAIEAYASAYRARLDAWDEKEKKNRKPGEKRSVFVNIDIHDLAPHKETVKKWVNESTSAACGMYLKSRGGIGFSGYDDGPGDVFRLFGIYPPPPTKFEKLKAAFTSFVKKHSPYTITIERNKGRER